MNPRHGSADDGEEPRPIIEELEVSPRPVDSGRKRVVPLVIGIVCALVAWGYFGGGDPDVPEPSDPRRSPVAAEPVHAVGARLDLPPQDAVVTGPVVNVRGSIDLDRELVRITVSLGELLLGTATVETRRGSFDAGVRTLVPRLAPPIPVTVSVVLASEPGTVLVERSIRLASAPAVTVERAAVRTDASGRALVLVEGAAAMDVRRVTVSLPGGEGQSVIVGPVRGPDTAPAARLFRVGRWAAAIPVDAAGAPVTVIVRWRDGSLAGGTSSLRADLETPLSARRPS